MKEDAVQLLDSLVQARDAQVARVVAMVDALPDRGEADALIAPLRPRLAQLRPVRPLGFIRLLFTPLNPLIVPAAEWQRSGIGVPRSALAPLGAAIRAALTARLGEADDTAGPVIWPAAAVALDGMTEPPDWSQASGLSIRDFAPVTAVIGAVLAEATAIERMARKRRAVDDQEIWAVLSRSKARSTLALDSVILVMLAQLAVPARVTALATEVAGSDRATGQAIDRLAASLAANGTETADVREAAMEAGRIAAMLDALEAGASPERRTRLEQLRRDADAVSRRSFSRAVDHTLAMAQSAMTASFDDGAITAIESCARDLRRLETAARRLGSSDFYDEQLASTAVSLRDLQGDLGLADRIRLVEILAGSDHAMALLTAARQAPAPLRAPDDTGTAAIA